MVLSSVWGRWRLDTDQSRGCVVRAGVPEILGPKAGGWMVLQGAEAGGFSIMGAERSLWCVGVRNKAKARCGGPHLRLRPAPYKTEAGGSLV